MTCYCSDAMLFNLTVNSVYQYFMLLWFSTLFAGKNCLQYQLRSSIHSGFTRLLRPQLPRSQTSNDHANGMTSHFCCYVTALFQMQELIMYLLILAVFLLGYGVSTLAMMYPVRWGNDLRNNLVIITRIVLHNKMWPYNDVAETFTR